MNFWDMVGDSSADIQSLITAENPDYDAILENPELLRTFIAKDDNLINFLVNPTTFDKIISIMMTHNNIKISKVCVELFVAKDSPLLNKLITEKSYSISLIKFAQSSLDSNDLVRIGYISRIYQKAAETPELQSSFIELFNSTLEILSFLTKIVYNTSVYDLVLSYLNIQKPENQWLIFSYLQMILPKGQSANCPKCFFQYKDNIIGLIKSLSSFKFTQKHKLSIIHIMKEIFNKEKFPDIVNVVSTNLPIIYEGEADNNEIRYLVLTLAAEFPPQKSILNISAKLIQKATSEQYGELENAALNILSLSPSKTLIILLPTIIDNFAKDTTNTFHHMAFLNFVKKSMKITELKDEFLKKLPPLILENAVASKWRQNANRVAFYLELADIIDKNSDSNLNENHQWKKFRDSELQKWRSRNEGLDEAPEAVAQSKHAIDPAKDDIDFPHPDDQNTNNKKSSENDIQIQATGISSSKNKEEKPEFPETPNNLISSNSQKQETPVFPAFPNIPDDINNQQNEKPEFPAFPNIPDDANNQQNDKPEFPAFPNISDDINNQQNEKPEFPAFPNISDDVNNQQNENPGFPAFPNISDDINNQQNDKPEFPAFPNIQDDANNQQNDKPEFPAFPNILDDANNQQNENSGFQVKSQPAPKSVDLDGDESFEHFMDLINNPCWEYHGPSPEELFGQKDRFTSPEDAYQFLINQA